MMDKINDVCFFNIPNIYFYYYYYYDVYKQCILQSPTNHIQLYL